MKRCSKCKELKDKSEFNKNPIRKDKLSVWCKDCWRIYARERSEQKRSPIKKYNNYKDLHRVARGVKQKRCGKCKELKDESEFRKNRSRKDGFCVWCKKCSRNYARKRYLENSKHFRRYLRYEESHRTNDGMKQKRCSKCKKWKDESKFGKFRYSKDGLNYACKDCRRTYAREHNTKEGKGLKKKYYIYEECHRVEDGVKQKRCCRCKRWKAESDFYKEPRYKDGLRYHCKECMRTYTREHYAKERKDLEKKYHIYEECHRVVGGIKQKLCCRCKRWKSESDFSKCRLHKDGLQYRCKACANKATNKAHKNRRRAVRN